MTSLHDSPLSCFAGTLTQRAPNDWRWRDGDREPRVHELATSLWIVPLRGDADVAGGSAIELPYAQAQAYDPLAWVIDACRDGRFEIDVSSHFPSVMRAGASGASTAVSTQSGVPVALVPIADWKRWRALCPSVPLWNSGDEAALFAHARALGWRG